MNFYSNGKLLITGEYAILDGAKALALPTKFGQSLYVEQLESVSKLSTKNNLNQRLLWQSIDEINKTWFQCEFKLPNFEIKCLDFETKKNKKIAKTLQFILKETKKLNPKFLNTHKSYHIKTALSFSKNWGLGSSSTLINNISNWANIDAFKLQFNTFGGSAYDIACAQNDSAIQYQLIQNKPITKVVNFKPKFKDQLYFVYLNKKKNSRNAIKMYQNSLAKITTNDKNRFINNISRITTDIINQNSIIEFEKLIQEHEKIIAKTINIKPIKEQLFKDYFGQIKSLGAWGGDFILATGNSDTSKYFIKKGFETVIAFEDMIL